MSRPGTEPAHSRSGSVNNSDVAPDRARATRPPAQLLVPSYPSTSASFPELYANSSTAFDEVPTCLTDYQSCPSSPSGGSNAPVAPTEIPPEPSRRARPPPPVRFDQPARPTSPPLSLAGDSTSNDPNAPSPGAGLRTRDSSVARGSATSGATSHDRSARRGGRGGGGGGGGGRNDGIGRGERAEPCPFEKPRKLVLERFSLYETKTKYYIVATNQADERYRILKVDRAVTPTAPPSIISDASGGGGNGVDEDVVGEDQLTITEDATIYSREEKDQLLETLAAGNLGGISLVEKSFYGIAGFVRFTSTYYMVLIKKRAAVGFVGGHYIYHCEGTVLRPVTPSSSGTTSSEETRRITAFQNVDLNKYFYFSYTYDITQTLQKNFTRARDDHAQVSQPSTDDERDVPPRWNDKFVWNHKLLVPMLQTLKGDSPWILPMIYGSVDQAKLSVFGRTVYITLIARRSRHFAGARYRRRGVTEDGFVANDVESEQIVADALVTPFFVPNSRATSDPSEPIPLHNRSPSPRYTSHVQIRGSIPVYWSQETGTYKPPIEIAPIDPFFAAGARHFDHLFELYGAPVVVFNLIRRKDGQESTLLAEFEQCLNYLRNFLPDKNQLRYIHYDIKAARKEKKDVIHVLEENAQDAIEWTQFFHSGSEAPRRPKASRLDTPERHVPLLQTGVVRTNCIDCVDRTNTVQFMIGKVALGHQLRALGIIDDPKISTDSDAYSLLAELWHNHGGAIALQYGGSHLVNTLDSYAERPLWSSQSRDKWQTVRRYYSNSFADAEKQAAIDLFLGVQPALPPRPTFGEAGPASRRSYIDWFTPAYLERALRPDEIAAVLQETLDQSETEEESSYWRSYYRPHLLTSLAIHFGCTVQSSYKFRPAGSDEYSPFAPRSIPHNPRLGAGPFRYLLQGVHGQKPPMALPTQPRQSRLSPLPPHEVQSSQPTPSSNPTTTAGLAEKHLRPLVKIDEAREYEAYVEQFDNLSLSQDLSEKDRILYSSKTELARSCGMHRGNEISEKDRAIYSVCANLELRDNHVAPPPLPRDVIGTVVVR